jgi:hypothetical protein
MPLNYQNYMFKFQYKGKVLVQSLEVAVEAQNSEKHSLLNLTRHFTDLSVRKATKQQYTSRRSSYRQTVTPYKCRGLKV